MTDLPMFHCKRILHLEDGVITASFHCPHCDGMHTHGDPDGSGGHRVAHCYKPNSPYLERGYVLAPAAKPY